MNKIQQKQRFLKLFNNVKKGKIKIDFIKIPSENPHKKIKPIDWRNGVIKRLNQQIAMLKKTFLAWMKAEINDKQFSFEMSNHLAAFSEILKQDQE